MAWSTSSIGRVTRVEAARAAGLAFAAALLLSGGPAGRGLVVRAQEGPTPTIAAPATRTPRPTRTPRVTPTGAPTPWTAGALKMTLAAEPPLPVAGQAVRYELRLANAGEALSALTIDLVLPADFRLERLDDPFGQSAQAADLVRWFVPRLEPDAEAVLGLSGLVDPAAAGPQTLCALLLSAGAPAEHCARFGLAQAGAEGPEAGTPGSSAEAAWPSPTPVPAATVWRDLSGGTGASGLLLILGLGAFGVWLGLQRRSARGPE